MHSPSLCLLVLLSHRSGLDCRRIEAEEFQRPPHAVVRRPPRAEFAGDTTGGGAEARCKRADSRAVGSVIPGACQFLQCLRLVSGSATVVHLHILSPPTPLVTH